MIRRRRMKLLRGVRHVVRRRYAPHLVCYPDLDVVLDHALDLVDSAVLLPLLDFDLALE